MPQCTPCNIMEEILYGKEDEASVSSLSADSQLFFLIGEPAGKKARVRDKKTTRKPKKRKVTHYLSPGTREELDKLREQLLLLFPEIGKNTFSRSNIVDKTLESYLKRFQNSHDGEALLQLFLADKKSVPDLDLFSRFSSQVSDGK